MSGALEFISSVKTVAELPKDMEDATACCVESERGYLFIVEGGKWEKKRFCNDPLITARAERDAALAEADKLRDHVTGLQQMLDKNSMRLKIDELQKELAELKRSITGE